MTGNNMVSQTLLLQERQKAARSTLAQEIADIAAWGCLVELVIVFQGESEIEMIHLHRKTMIRMIQLQTMVKMIHLPRKTMIKNYDDQERKTIKRMTHLQTKPIIRICTYEGKQ